MTLKRKHTIEICNLLIESRSRVSWACPNGIRADNVDEELLKLMKVSGCYFVAYGIESANPTILQNIKKNDTIDVMRDSIEIARKVGISCQGFLFLDYQEKQKRQ